VPETGRAASRSTSVEIHITDVEHGLWCSVCLLPSVVTVHYVLVNSVTLKTAGFNQTTFCPDCKEADE
jgi:Zn finger protein HypA/HybF involved in hydrogenase expression